MNNEQLSSTETAMLKSKIIERTWCSTSGGTILRNDNKHNSLQLQVNFTLMTTLGIYASDSLRLKSKIKSIDGVEFYCFCYLTDCW